MREVNDEYTEANSGHAIVLLYRKYYRRVYETGSIIDKGPMKLKNPVVKKDIQENNDQIGLFIIFTIT